MTLGVQKHLDHCQRLLALSSLAALLLASCANAARPAVTLSGAVTAASPPSSLADRAELRQLLIGCELREREVFYADNSAEDEDAGPESMVGWPADSPAEVMLKAQFEIKRILEIPTDMYVTDEVAEGSAMSADQDLRHISVGRSDSSEALAIVSLTTIGEIWGVQQIIYCFK